jgi:hypothetical protein
MILEMLDIDTKFLPWECKETFLEACSHLCRHQVFALRMQRNFFRSLPLELSKKSSKTEYTYPLFCINFTIVIKYDTLPPDITIKLHCFYVLRKRYGRASGRLEEQLVT